MGHIKQYILALVAISILCSFLVSVTSAKGPQSNAIKIITGLAIVCVMLSPLIDFQFTQITDHFAMASANANDIVAAGEAMAENAMQDIIKESFASYILDRAKTLNVNLQVEVTLSESFTPESVQLKGSITPYARSVLQEYIASELGIAKERQHWT